MAKMPTTRYERFLFFKARAQRRLQRCRVRRRNPNREDSHSGVQEREIRFLPYQAVKKYPKIVGATVEAIPGVPWLKDEREGSGLPPLWKIDLVFGVPQAKKHHRRAIGAVERRVKRCPRLKHLAYRRFPRL